MLIPRPLLSAALLCAATDKNHQGRPMLNGVYVEQAKGGVWIVGTDGYGRLAAFHSAPDDVLPLPSVIIPRDALTAALKLDKRSELDVTATTLGALAYTPVDGQFPQWRRVLPGATLSGVWPAHFDADLLARAVKAVNVANDVKHHGLSVSMWPDTDKIMVRGARDKCIAFFLAARDNPKYPYEPLEA